MYIRLSTGVQLRVNVESPSLTLVQCLDNILPHACFCRGQLYKRLQPVYQHLRRKSQGYRDCQELHIHRV